MIKIIKSHDRHFSDFEWLKTYWLFSFADYYDPDNIQFGALRVFNDDIVEPNTGFPIHPHHDMEIVTVVIEGEITHEDSIGNKAIIKQNDVQRMTAGTGINHSEFNLGENPVHFLQIWIYPDKKGLEPSYEQLSYDPSLWKNNIYPIVSGKNHSDIVSFSSDSVIYRGEFEPGFEMTFNTDVFRRIFIYMISGSLNINGKKIKTGSQARIDLEEELVLKTDEESSDFILIDVPSCKGYGYDKKTLRGEKKFNDSPAL